MNPHTYILMLYIVFALIGLITLSTLIFLALNAATLKKKFMEYAVLQGLLAVILSLALILVDSIFTKKLTQYELTVVVIKIPQMEKLGVISTSRDISIFNGKDTISNVVVSENQSMPLVGDTIVITKDIMLNNDIYSY